MNKKLLSGFVALLMFAGLFAVVGCSGAPAASSSDSGPSGEISVYSREDGSGTRGAFIELFGILEDDVDKTTTSAAITNSTSVMMTSVAGDPNAIGYISLGSLDASVKALQIDGVEATVANVKSGDYKISRPFNIAIKEDDLSDEAQDFINFIMSSDGQDIIVENGYIAIDENADAYKASGNTGKVVVAGSSSVTPVMEKLIEAYEALNSDADIDLQTSDSTTGMNMAMDGTCDIGMASRELKDSETSGGLTGMVIAQDGIAIIVSNDLAVDGLTSEQVKNIYTGAVTLWEDALA